MDFPPVPGGISAHVYELGKAYVDLGHTVAVVTRHRGSEPIQSMQSGMTIYRVALRLVAFIYGLQIRRFVRQLLPILEPDIIHIHGMGPLEWYNINHLPLAYTNHTSGYLKRIKKGGFRRMAMLRRHFKKVDLFLAPSEELLQIPFEIKAPKYFIANGVDASKFVFSDGQRTRVRQELGLEKNDIVAIITRRLVDKNGVIYLAKATQFLRNKSIKFVVIGDGPERKAVEDTFKKHCGERAIFLGNKTHKEIVAYYSAADFSVLPSLLEATSISGLEAMAASLPLVGTRVGGIPELISHGENGFLCNPADPEDLAQKINVLLESDFRALGRKSRRLVEEHFDWPIIAHTTLTAYREILNN